MGHKCFISFKTEDVAFKKYIQTNLNIDMIDKSLNEAIDSDNEDYIMRKIREDFLSDTTVTIHLIGLRSAESLGWEEQKFIKRELQASLYHGDGNTQNGILGVVIPNAYDLIFCGNITCMKCGGNHSIINVKDNTISEFSYNYYLPNGDKCAWSENDRYCVLVKWDDFKEKPEDFIDLAFDKRNQPVANKTKVRP